MLLRQSFSTETRVITADARSRIVSGCGHHECPSVPCVYLLRRRSQEAFVRQVRGTAKV
jgi:hypothetical protein